MTIAQMLSQSGMLTLLGMCVVFCFLIIMILAMSLLHVVVHALHLDKDLENKDTSSSSAVTAAPAQDSEAVIAAIAAAVHEKESL